MSREFIPVTTALTDPSFVGSPAGRWFGRMADAHKEPGGHNQGFYILTADGHGPTRLGPDHPDDLWRPARVLQFLDEGLSMARTHATDPAKVADLHEPNLRADYIALPAPGVSVVRQFTRVAGERRGDLNDLPDRDHLWVYPEEVRAILLASRGTTVEFPLPARLASRLARFQLIDNVGGRSLVFTAPEHVKRVALFARAVRSGNEGQRRRFTVAGDWACGTTDGGIGIEGKIEGEFEIDEATSRLTRFRAFAGAEAWGGASSNAETPPSGRFRVTIALMEADDALARGIPPVFAHLGDDYREAWHTLTPPATWPGYARPDWWASLPTKATPTLAPALLSPGESLLVGRVLRVDRVAGSAVVNVTRLQAADGAASQEFNPARSKRVLLPASQRAVWEKWKPGDAVEVIGRAGAPGKPMRATRLLSGDRPPR